MFFSLFLILLGQKGKAPGLMGHYLFGFKAQSGHWGKFSTFFVSSLGFSVI